ncbi:hypothetical protein CMUS01_05802 [Colletotrichum musicola]|uniref:Uncharacterized protein n=1 Tax=Colletotrichum musicola TaxID=2175873 RepID=A0A8H6KPL5_9PEZI|nr:hypothetical protein CMUS01_05802 [Colletotrichum musicola]
MRQLPGLATIGGEEFESLKGGQGQASNRPDPGQARPGTALRCTALQRQGRNQGRWLQRVAKESNSSGT